MYSVREWANFSHTKLVIPLSFISMKRANGDDAKPSSSNYGKGNRRCSPSENISERENKLSRLVKFDNPLRLALQRKDFSNCPYFLLESILKSR